MTKRCIVFDLATLALCNSHQATFPLVTATRRLDKDYGLRFLKCPRNWLNFAKSMTVVSDNGHWYRVTAIYI